MLLKTVTVGPLATNAYVFGSQETKEAIVIDPGAEGSRIAAELTSLGLTAVLLVSTHGHSDHTGGVAVLKAATGAVYAIHEADVPMLVRGSLLSQVFPDFHDAPGPDRLLKGGETLQVGEVGLLVLETPGHTPGSVCFYVQGMVFTGDTLFQMSIGRTDFPGGNQSQELTSIATKLLALPKSTVVYPGHGSQTTIADEKRRNPFLSQLSRC